MSRHEPRHEPIGGRLWTGPFTVLVLLSAVAALLLYQRFVMGLGSVANINDGYPWGIWVTVDVVIGTAFGCGGFAMALVVYILNRGEYHPLMRPALLAGLFGYTLGGIAVGIDLGRYWQMYNIFVPGFAQPNSVMFEVALCVAAYIVVLWIEFSPVFLEKLGWTGTRTAVKGIMFVCIALGVLLPTMHQSSLGTLLVILGFKLSPLWNTTLLPLLFLISALAMGYAIVIFEAVAAAVIFRRPIETGMLGRLSGIMVWVVAAYLVIRLADLAVRGAFAAVDGGTQGTLFLVETALFVFPLVILLVPANRRNPQALGLAALFLLFAGSLYRINSYLVGFEPGNGWHYFPAASEIMVTIGIFAFEGVLYLIFVKKLPVLHRLARA